jgi:hypothetical protein
MIVKTEAMKPNRIGCGMPKIHNEVIIGVNSLVQYFLNDRFFLFREKHIKYLD